MYKQTPTSLFTDLLESRSKGNVLKPKVTHPCGTGFRVVEFWWQVKCGKMVRDTNEMVTTNHRSFEWYDRRPLVGPSHSPLEFWLAISSQRVIRSTSCLVLDRFFWVGTRRIEWRYKLIRYLFDLLRSLWPRKVVDASVINNGATLVGVFVRLTDIH